MTDLPPFDPPYQPISAEFGRAMLAFEKAPAPAGAKGNLFFLLVPFAEKDEAKGLGAKWDAAARKWYVPQGKENELFKRWWPAS